METFYDAGGAPLQWRVIAVVPEAA